MLCGLQRMQACLEVTLRKLRRILHASCASHTQMLPEATPPKRVEEDGVVRGESVLTMEEVERHSTRASAWFVHKGEVRPLPCLLPFNPVFSLAGHCLVLAVGQDRAILEDLHPVGSTCICHSRAAADQALEGNWQRQGGDVASRCCWGRWQSLCSDP